MFLDLGEGLDHKAVGVRPREASKKLENIDDEAQKLPNRLEYRKSNKKKPKARPADKAGKGLVPKTVFDPPEIVRFGPFSPNTFYVLFSVVFGPLPHKHGEARIRHLDLKNPGTSRSWRRELNTLRIVKDLAPGSKNLSIAEDLASGS